MIIQVLKKLQLLLELPNGTLYYHFSSKEEIFNFLVEEGMKLLKNSIEIKIQKCETTKDKIRAVILIQVKAVIKYRSVLSIIFSQIYGNEARNKICVDKVAEYIDVVKSIIDEGVKKGEINKCNSKFLAYTIFSLTSTIMMYTKNEEYDISEIFKECEASVFGDIFWAIIERNIYRLVGQ